MVKTLLYVCVLLWAGADFDIGKIAKINRLKEEAEAAYKSGQYNVAINRYNQLVDMGVNDEPVLLNLAHAYFMNKDTTAINAYSKLVLAKDNHIKSVAYQQMGVIKANGKKYEEALKFFKESLKAAPNNEEARHNYELTKKLLEEQRKQQQQDKQNQQNKDKQQQRDKEQQQKEQQQKKEQDEKGEQKDKGNKQEKDGKDDKTDGKKEQGEKDDESDKKGKEEEKEAMERRAQRLQQMNLTEEQAKMILDAMKNNEVQYLQQNKKKPTKKINKNKPDW
jgi:tetratricopeptide (TPR) repeat protein